jgi:photosystem II stability/assembly factor-like uncharacterized protein
MLTGVLLAISCGAAVAQTPESAFDGLAWRLVGPFRGGWATMAAGVPDRPDTFYIGTAGGGVWKTVNAGRTWSSMADRIPPAIGAIAVAPSRPDTIYVGTGQVAPRYDIAAGRGMFKSVDGGRTWIAIGLADTRHIGAIWVDPHDENTLVVAALGPLFRPGSDRGIYRSTDGGRTWSHVLAIDPATGAVDLAADPSHPGLLYAAAWQAQLKPWLSYSTPIVGPGSGIYRSTDGGRSWSRLAGGGWPQGPVGRIGLAVAHTANGTRVYATVDSKNSGGVWRSDDGGEHWRRVNDDAETFGNWYFSRLTVDPRNPDTLYAVGQSIRRSRDGGKTWTVIKGAPGGDDYHYLWINPHHPDHWITASDQGAVVTIDDGATWSSWYNQPTGQFYHLAADDRFPYWVYSGQQDSGTVGAASRSDYGSLTFRDWHPVGGDERDYMIPDPDDPLRVYGSGLGGRISRWDGETGQVSNVSPWPVSSYGKRPDTVKYHYAWVMPIAITPTRPHRLLAGSQVLFASNDGGDHWEVVSPDLTGARSPGAGCGDDVTVERGAACGYGVIQSIAPSPRASGMIWVGTDSGLIHLTRDGGRHWKNVTPPVIAPWAKVSAIDASALDANTAYAAIDAYRLGDFRPHILRTHDGGASWKEITAGLPAGEFVSVVRADPVRRGLLYAGTSEGVFVSLDDGGHWQSLQLELPKAWVRDLLVHGDDLIAATQGRAIWILDDVTPLRQLTSAGSAGLAQHGDAEPLPAALRGTAHLFKPELAWRVHANNNRDTPLPPETPVGRNPPAGVPIDYWLGQESRGPVSLEIRDVHGTLVRRFSSDEKPQPVRAERYFEEDWLKPEPRLAATPGMHRFVWNLRRERPRAMRYEYSIRAIFGEDTPTEVEGAFVLPGRYTVELKAAGGTYRAPLTVRLDPRVHASEADLVALDGFTRALDEDLELAAAADAERESAHVALEALAHRLHGDAAHAVLGEQVVSMAQATHQATGKDGLGAVSTVLSALDADAESADRAPTSGQRQVAAEYSAELRKAVLAWRELRDHQLAALDVQLRAAGLTTIGGPPEAGPGNGGGNKSLDNDSLGN